VRLVELDHERRTILGQLVARGFRSRGFVGEWGELIAAAHYDGKLAPASERGFDLIDRDGRRVQVKTLRSTPENERTSMGVLAEPYDVLFALRLGEDFVPFAAFEIPRRLLDDRYRGKRTTLTRWLETHPEVVRPTREELLQAAEVAHSRLGSA